MSLSADSKGFIELLNSRGVEYVIVGAHSLAFHGHPRYTGDLDILVRPSQENAEKITAVISELVSVRAVSRRLTLLNPIKSFNSAACWAALI
jgi:hypothetical protein